MTNTQRKLLKDAYARPGNYVCPTKGLVGCCQTSVLASLLSKGLITSYSSPTLTDYGLAVAEDIVHEEAKICR